VQRPAGERGEAGAEDGAGVDQVGVRDDASASAALASATKGPIRRSASPGGIAPAACFAGFPDA